MKDLIKIENSCKFDQYRICDCQVNNFPRFAYHFSIHARLILGFFLAHTSPNLVQFCWYFTRGGILTEKNCFFHNFWDIRILMWTERNQSLHFDLLFSLLNEDARNWKYLKTISCTFFREKQDYCFALFGLFLVENRAESLFIG